MVSWQHGGFFIPGMWAVFSEWLNVKHSGIFTIRNKTRNWSVPVSVPWSAQGLIESSWSHDHKRCLSEHFLSQALVAEELWPGTGPIGGDYRICRVILWGWCLWKGSERSTPTLVPDQQAGSAKVNRVKRCCHHILCGVRGPVAAEPGFS